MADETTMSEQERAELSKRRGQAAAQITDPEQKRKFIAAQGETEASSKGQLPRAKGNELSTEAALKGYKKGTMNVPKTGKAMIHKGEAVLDKKSADHYRAAMGALAGKDVDMPTAPEKEIKEIRIRKGHGGKGRIVEHHHTRPEHHPMEEHVMSSMADLHKHLDEHMPDGDEPQGQPEEAEPSVVAAQEAGGQ